MKDYCLKFASQDEMESELIDAGFDVDEDGGFHHPHCALHIIGVMYQPSGDVVVVDGEPVDVMEPVDGWHVNIRTWGDAVFPSEFVVTPKTPSHVWYEG